MKNYFENDQLLNKFVMSLAQTRALAVEAVKARAFPKEFRKGFWESLDKRFASIVLICLIVGYGGMIGLLLGGAFQVDPDVYRQKVKNQFLTTILKKAPVAIVKKDEPKVDETKKTETVSSKLEEAAAPTAKTLDKTDEKQVEEFQKNRAEQVSQAKASYQAAVQQQAAAVLATLTARSRGGARTSSSGSAVDVLGAAKGGVNLNDVLAGSGASAGKGIGLGTATSRADIGRGGAGVGKLGAVGTGSGLGAGSGVGDALARGGSIKAKISTGKVKSAGANSRTAAELGSVIEEQQRAIQSCYETEKAKDPTLKGSITIGIQIQADGRVVGPRVVSSTMKNTNLERCIINKVRLWQFSAVTDPKPQTLEFSYNFTD